MKEPISISFQTNKIATSKQKQCFYLLKALILHPKSIAFEV